MAYQPNVDALAQKLSNFFKNLNQSRKLMKVLKSFAMELKNILIDQNGCKNLQQDLLYPLVKPELLLHWRMMKNKAALAKKPLLVSARVAAENVKTNPFKENQIVGGIEKKDRSRF